MYKAIILETPFTSNLLELQEAIEKLVNVEIDKHSRLGLKLHSVTVLQSPHVEPKTIGITRLLLNFSSSRT